MEVEVKLRFTTPCLGNERHAQRDLMLRSGSGHVALLQSWWRACLAFAAQALNQHQRDIESIQADPEVDGNVTIHKRYWSDREFKEHECFAAGEVVTARFFLPNEVPVDDFRCLLETAGKYAGISPYGYRQNFGRFVVVSVTPIRRVSAAAKPKTTGAG